MADWETIKIPKEMADRIEEIIQTHYAKEIGFTSKSQIVVTAVRDYLYHYSNNMTYLELVDITNDLVKLRDYELNSIIEIVIDGEKGTAYCKKDKTTKCAHVNFLFLIPRFQNILKHDAPLMPKAMPAIDERKVQGAKKYIDSLPDSKRGKEIIKELRDYLDNKLIP